MALDPQTFRQTLRRWASGVTVVTAQHDGELRGMTVSAFSSVSADPPIVLVCANQSSSTESLIVRSGAFAVHLLGADQEHLSKRFSDAQFEGARFDGLQWRTGAAGAPILPDTLARLECTLMKSERVGSHTVCFGRVGAAEWSDGEPLVYFNGSYRLLG